MYHSSSGKIGAAGNLNQYIWSRMNDAASEWAKSDRPLPNEKESTEQVQAIVDKALSPQHMLPTQVCKFYADEFHDMVAKHRGAKKP